MSDNTERVSIRLHVYGQIKSLSGTWLPVTLPGVTVRLKRSERGTALFTKKTGATGWTETFDVPLSSKFCVEVEIGKDEKLKNIIQCGDFTASSISTGETEEFKILVNLEDLKFTWALNQRDDGTQVDMGIALPYGTSLFLALSGLHFLQDPLVISTITANGTIARQLGGTNTSRRFTIPTGESGPFVIRLALGSIPPGSMSETMKTVEDFILPPNPTNIEGGISVGLRRSTSRFTEDVPLWVSIRKGTEALGFDQYFNFMNWVFCNDNGKERVGDASWRERVLLVKNNSRRFLPFTDTDAYRNIKVATEAFVMANCGVFSHFDIGDAEYVQGQVSLPKQIPPETLSQLLTGKYLQSVSARGVPEGLLPYLAIIRRKLDDQRINKDRDIGDVLLSMDPSAPGECYGILRQRLTCPCLLELIWSYWQEEGMLVQTMNALTRRFQNIRSPMGNDPLANMEIDPLRSLNNVIWGYIQDEQHRLTVVRRNYEYDHHYGLRLAGRAVREVRTADSRSKFLEAFHTLLSITSAFYKRDDDTTIVADGFPVLNGLKEAHLILTQGAHNQYGDLPSTARIEMLMQQWILSRPEFREFLPTRIMVAYPEPWMDRVDAMKKLQGWTDTSVLHFRNLAIFGEQVLLAVRYGNWSSVNDPVQGTNWARYWRPEIQGYMHAYRSVTGIDLSADVTNTRIDATLPSVHLVQRLTEQRRSA